MGRPVEMMRFATVGHENGGEGERREERAGWTGAGRARSESWERVRRVREAELENEMRRLGMI